MLLRMSPANAQPGEPQPGEPHLELARAFVTTVLGFRPESAIVEDLPRRLERLAREVGESDVRRLAYRIYGAEPGSDLHRVAVRELTIGETWLFRDGRTLRLLTEVLLPQLGGGPATRRIWSAGCSTGEEVHSLAFLCRELAVAGTVEIVGTDIAADRLALARSGRYPARVRRGKQLPPGFARAEGNELVIRPVPGTRLRFEQHNLAADPAPDAPGGHQLVVCRNVLMYLGLEVRRRALGLFLDALAEGGYLLLGPTDVIDTPELIPATLRPTPQHPALYQKVTTAAEEPPPGLAAPPRPQPAPAPTPAPRAPAPRAPAPRASAPRAPAPGLTPKDRARLRVLGAQARLADGILHEAELACLEALDLDPAGVEAVVVLAQVAVARGEPTVARRLLEAVAAERGETPTIRAARAALDAAAGPGS